MLWQTWQPFCDSFIRWFSTCVMLQPHVTLGLRAKKKLFDIKEDISCATTANTFFFEHQCINIRFIWKRFFMIEGCLAQHHNLFEFELPLQAVVGKICFKKITQSYFFKQMTAK